MKDFSLDNRLMEPEDKKIVPTWSIWWARIKISEEVEEKLISRYELMKEYSETTSERILQKYVDNWEAFSKADLSEIDTYKSNELIYEERYWIGKLTDSLNKYHIVNWYICWFHLDIWNLKWSTEEGKEWIDIEHSFIIDVNYDNESSKLSDEWKNSFGSHSYIPYKELSQQIAKEWCEENWYEIERKILDIPNVRWLIKEKWTSGFFSWGNEDYSKAQDFFENIWK